MTTTLPDVVEAVDVAPLRLDVGVHEVAFDDYLADPCVEPSLNASGANILLEQTPLHFQTYHPRLTQFADRARKGTREQDLGSLVHALVLGQGKEFEIVEADDWRTKAAQQARNDAAVVKRVAVLAKTFAQAEAIADVARGRLADHFGGWPIGESERTVIWRRETPAGRVYCRASFDHWSDDRTQIIDLKTTGKSLAPDDLAKKLAGDGADLQAAFYIEGAEALHPHLRGRVEFLFAAVEVEPPYALVLARIPEAWLHMARRRIDKAADTFARCLKTGSWPGWSDEPVSLSMPPWHERRWLEEELTVGADA